MNSKLSAQILYSSFVLLLIIVESLQSPILEDKRSHKLMRFGRATHQMMHFGKRDPQKMMHFGKRDIATNEVENLINGVANGFINDDNDEYSSQLINDNAPKDALLNYLLDGNFNPRENDVDLIRSPSLARRSPPARFLGQPRKASYFKKADNRDNVFMHFG